MLLFRSVPSFFVACLLSSTVLAKPHDAVATGVVFVDKNGSRTREADETGLAGVGVSNGRDVVQTDADGRLNDSDWQPMQKPEKETDPIFQALFDEEQPSLPDNLPWRKLAKPMVCPHLWKATLKTSQQKGTHLIQVRATNPNGQVLKGERVIRVE